VNPPGCPRCGQAAGLSRWCVNCGLDLRPDLPPSDIAEARQAELVESRWRERHGESATPEAPAGGFLPPTGAGPTTFGSPVYTPPAPGRGYRSPRGAALVTAILMGLCGVIAVLALAVDVVWLNEVGAEGNSPEVVMDLAHLMDRVSLFQLIGFVAVAVAFIVWLFRAYGNLPVLGIVKPRYARAWTIGAWFVPIANLIIPKHLTNDVWRAGDPGLAHGEPGWQKRQVAATLHLWWAANLVGGALIRLGTTQLGNATGFEEARNAVIVDALGQGITAVAALAAIWVIRHSTDRQEARASALRGAGALPASA
jgi:eukaryotic-like serine/threonine-protein kinase